VDFVTAVRASINGTSAVDGHDALERSKHFGGIALGSKARRHKIREQAFHISGGKITLENLMLLKQTPKEWTNLLKWLDASGLALYFAGALINAGKFDDLPAYVSSGLRRRLQQNEERTRGLHRESSSIQKAFQSAAVTYAVMKGESLAPFSVPRSELRHQFDLDYLVAEADATKAREALKMCGYSLYAISGKTWEFKKGETPYVSARDLYKDLPYRGVELHLEPMGPSRLTRAETRALHGMDVPVLCARDILVGQAKHIVKDLRGSFVRGSHIIEFYRHITSLYRDTSSCANVDARSDSDSYEMLSMNIALQLLSEIFGDCDADLSRQLMSPSISTEIRLWLRLYGKLSFLSAPPGTKFGLLLDEAVRHQVQISKLPAQRVRWWSSFPPAVIRATPLESVATRCRRYGVQMRFLSSRFRFHVIEGARLAVERRRWKRLIGDISWAK
jgi:hypothetical protein